MTPVNLTQYQSAALHRVVELDERTIARFAPLAVAIHAAAVGGEPVHQHRDNLLAELADTLAIHAEFDKAARGSSQEDACVQMLTSAMAAQHRSLAARVEELAHTTTGLDAVALTRTIHAILNLTLDLAHRVLDHLAAHDVGLPGATNRRS